MTAVADTLGQAWDSGAVLAGGCLVAVVKVRTAAARTIGLRQTALDALAAIPAGQWVKLPDIKAGTAHKLGRALRGSGREVALRYLGDRGHTADVWVRCTAPARPRATFVNYVAGVMAGGPVTAAIVLPFSRRTAPASVPVETVTGPVSPAGPVATQLPQLPREAMSSARFEVWRQQVVDAPGRHSAAVRFFDEFEALPRLVTP